MSIDGDRSRGDVVLCGGQVNDLEAAQLVSREDHELGVDVGDGGGEAHGADLAEPPGVVPRRDGEELLGAVREAEHGDVVSALGRSSSNITHSSNYWMIGVTKTNGRTILWSSNSLRLVTWYKEGSGGFVETNRYAPAEDKEIFYT